MNLLLDEIAKAVNGALQGQGDGIARGYSIDTRTLNPGDLFFAVKGPRFDGHQFVPRRWKRRPREWLLMPASAANAKPIRNSL